MTLSRTLKAKPAPGRGRRATDRAAPVHGATTPGESGVMRLVVARNASLSRAPSARTRRGIRTATHERVDERLTHARASKRPRSRPASRSAPRWRRRRRTLGARSAGRGDPEPAAARRGRAPYDICDGALGDDAAAVEDEDARRRYPRPHPGNACSGHGRAPVAGDRPHHLEHLSLARGVEPERRLVEEHDLRDR